MKIIIPIICYIFFNNCFANTNESQNIINSIIKKKHFPSCSIKDYYYLEKLNNDAINFPVIESDTLVISAKEVLGQEKNMHIANKDVVIYQGDNTLTANWLIYDQSKSRVTGGDNIIFVREFDVLQGTWVDYYLDLNKGVIKNVKGLQNKSNIYVEGEEVNISSRKTFAVKNGYITTCDPKNPAWYLSSQNISFDYNTNTGNARNSTFYFESAPLLYSPFWTFPLGTRKSGFLNPIFAGNSSATGVVFGLPYYWNMAPNYDMTITPKIYTTNGIMVTGEFRYLASSGSGIFYTEQLPNDWITNQYRYYWKLKDEHFIVTPKVRLGFDYNVVSDNNYFVNYSDGQTVAQQINLPQTVYANFKDGWGGAGIKVQEYQVIQPVNYKNTQGVYYMLPQINFNVNPQKILGSPVAIDLVAQYTKFTSNYNLLQAGQRVVLYPSLTIPLQATWGYIKPKIGADFLNYELEPYSGFQQNASVINRLIPIFYLDSGLFFDRQTSFFNKSYVQTFEPRLYYLFVPELNQANTPVFDTAPITYNLNQLFVENRFAGADRVSNSNSVTLGLTSKMINDNNGEEVSNFGLGYRYYFTPENIFMYGGYNSFPVLFLPRPNLIAEAKNNWAYHINSTASFQYSTIYDNITYYSIGAQFNPSKYKIINAKFTYTYQLPLLYYAWQPGTTFNPPAYENQYALDFSFQWPLIWENVLLEGRLNYDFTAKTILNSLVGLEYDGGCWSISGIVEKYIVNITQYATSYFIEFRLKGFTSVGNTANINEAFSSQIPGYMPLDK